MQREIKFRAWNIPNKLMYQNVQDGILAENEKGQLILGVSLGKLSKDAGSVLMQFSGLHDKNGKEIYEGDIVKSNKNDFYINGNKSDVYFLNGSFCISILYDTTPVQLYDSRIFLILLANNIIMCYWLKIFT